MGNKINTLFGKFEEKYKINKNFRILVLLIIIVIFCFVYIQGPLYRSNQHTKFLHGLAKAGYGYLKNDWLAQTIDPLPVFSFLVYFTVKFLHEYIFYLYFIIILGIYVFSLLKISSNIFNFNNSLLANVLFFTLIAILHSTIIFDSLTYKLFHYRVIEFFFEEGVAGQYMVGRVFQPCIFGVFLILSIFLFLNNKPFLAIFFLGVTSTFHTAYLFSSGVLTLSYMIIIYKEEKKLVKPFLLGLISLILILPVTIYHLTALKATSPELSKKAMDILVKIRIPHHSDPKIWLNISAYLKAMLIGIAIFIIRKKRIFIILIIPFITAIIFTIFEFFTENDFVGFLAPWRVSVWLVPISICIIIGYLLSISLNKFKDLYKKFNVIFSGICILILFLLFIGGISIIVKNNRLYLNKDHGPMMNYVSANKKINDVFLVPVNMKEFRLNTGAPVLVSWKSHPYKDREIIEWYERINIANDFYEKINNGEDIKSLVIELENKYSINHIVVEKNKIKKEYSYLNLLYKDPKYCIYKIALNIN